MNPAPLGLRPAGDRRTASTDVERRENTSGLGPGDRAEHIRVSDGEGADNHGGGAGDQPTPGQVAVTDPACDLDGDAGGGDDVGDRLAVVARAAGRIEVDEVDAMGAGVGEGAGKPHRVVGIGGLAREVALFEPDRAAAAQVDRRNDVQR